MVSPLELVGSIRMDVNKFDQLQGEYNAYVIEVLPPDGLEDEITQTIKDNRSTMGALLGGENVYLNVLDQDELNELFERQEVNTGRVQYSMPWLFILDDHPSNVEKGDEFLIIELGNLENTKQVTDVLRRVGEYISDDDFFRALTWEERKQKLKKAFPEFAGLAISVAGLA